MCIKLFRSSISCLTELNNKSILPGALFIAMFLKLLPLITSTVRRPVVPLYPKPRRSSGMPPCCIDWVDEALSLLDKLETSNWESPPWNRQNRLNQWQLINHSYLINLVISVLLPFIVMKSAEIVESYIQYEMSLNITSPSYPSKDLFFMFSLQQYF